MARPHVSVATICFDGFGDKDFVPAFTYAPELGIHEIEFNAWYPRNLTPAGLESIRRRCDEAGLRPVTLHVSGFAPGPERADLSRETQRWMWLFEAADRLGVHVVKATGSDRGSRGGLDATISLLRVIAPVAEERGMTIALENHAGNVLEHPEDYRTVFAQVDSAAVGMCFDTGHFAASGHDLVAVAKEFAGRIVQVDLKDCKGPGPGAFVRFGEGSVNFDAVLREIMSGDCAVGHILVEFPLAERATMMADLRAGAAIAHRFGD